MVPSLKLLRLAYPEAELHVLVEENAVDILQDIPWINKVWGFPRKRSEAQLKRSLPLLWKLRRMQFDLSIDFVGNDRGAFTSLAIGAKKRIGCIAPKGFFGRSLCYTMPVNEAAETLHEMERNAYLLSPLGIKSSGILKPELYCNRYEDFAQKSLPANAILCHLSTSMPKKEWPVYRWVELYKENPGKRFIFTSGPSAREQALLTNLMEQCPGIQVIREIPSVGHFMALIKEASMIISGDSLPAHLAAGLGKELIVLFGPTHLHQWHPRGAKTIALKAPDCDCIGHPHVCPHNPVCMGYISAEEVSGYIS